MEILEKMGLSPTESKIYLTLLKIKEGTASALATESKVHRRLAYDVLSHLSNKGLVSFVDLQNKRVYTCVDPKHLHDILDEREEKIADLRKLLEKQLPDLQGQFLRKKREREVQVMVGKEAIKRLFQDEIEVGETIYLIGSPSSSEQLLKYYLPKFSRNRYKNKIKIKGLFDYDLADQLSYKLMDVRLLPPDYESKVTIAIYGHKVGITFWSSDPLVILIDDPAANTSFKNFFDVVWNSAKPFTPKK